MPDFLAIPPTSGVADPQVRAVLDALAHNAREAQGDATSTELYEVARRAVTDVLAGGGGTTNTALDAVARYILTSRLLAELRTELGVESLEDVLSAEGRKRADAILGETQARTAAIAQEQQERQAADDLLASSIATLTASLNALQAAIQAEQEAREDADSDLSARIDALEASIGGAG